MPSPEDHFLRPLYKSATFWVAFVFAAAALAGEMGAYLSLRAGGLARAAEVDTGFIAAAACVVIGLVMLVAQHSSVRRAIRPGSGLDRGGRDMLKAAFWGVQIFYILCGAVLFLPWAFPHR